MSTQTGTATSYLDLLNKLRTFLTTDATLTGLGQNWTELKNSSSTYTGQPGSGDTVDFESYLRAPGLSGTETIYINIRAFHSVAGDYYNWEMRGAQGFNTGNAFIAQPGISPATFLYMWNQPMTYWFIANGQRVIVIAKVSSVYQIAYLGKFLPYGTPSQYPYPVAIGGCGASNGDLRFSDTSFSHLAFFDPNGLQICAPDNSWVTFQNWSTGGSANPSPFNTTWPYIYYSTNRIQWMSANLDGTYSVFPVQIHQNSPTNIYGEFDGVGFVTGTANSSESTITDGTNTWMVVQNVYRTSADSYCAVKMA